MNWFLKTGKIQIFLSTRTKCYRLATWFFNQIQFVLKNQLISKRSSSKNGKDYKKNNKCVAFLLEMVYCWFFRTR